MKKFLSIFFLIFSFAVNAQTFVLNDLLKMNKMSDDDFDTFVTQKGFKYSEYENDERKNAISYVFKSKEKFEGITKFVYAVNVSEISMVSYETSSSSNYLKLKNELKNNGFKITETGQDEFGSFMRYKKGKMLMILNSSLRELGFSKTTSYEISLAISR